MRIGTDEQGEILLSDVFSGVGVETDAGVFAICQRDSGIEIRLDDGPWYSWSDDSGPRLLPGQFSRPIEALEGDLK